MKFSVSPHIEPAGVDAVLISFGIEPSRITSSHIVSCARKIEAELGSVILDIIPGWDTLLIHYNVDHIDFTTLSSRVMPILCHWQDDQGEYAGIEADVRQHVMPVWYCGEDLSSIAAASGLSVDDVITRHTEGKYYVGAVGFMPGFAYMGGLDERLILPRRESPRTHVPKGSVAIAEAQTCIYPEASPGGWNLLGRCPLSLYDAERTPPGRFEVGDQVTFVSIDESLFNALMGQWEWDAAGGKQ